MLLRPVLNARARPFRPASARVAVCSKKVPKVVAGRLRAFGVRLPRVREIAPESFAKFFRNSNRNGFGTTPWTRSGAVQSVWRHPSDAWRVPIPAAVPAPIRSFADRSPPLKAVSTGPPRMTFRGKNDIFAIQYKNCRFCGRDVFFSAAKTRFFAMIRKSTCKVLNLEIRTSREII